MQKVKSVDVSKTKVNAKFWPALNGNNVIKAVATEIIKSLNNDIFEFVGCGMYNIQGDVFMSCWGDLEHNLYSVLM